jgi:hypothetical protein
VVSDLLEVGGGVGVEPGNALFGGLRGLEFGEEGDGVRLAAEGATGGGEPPPRDGAEDSAGVLPPTLVAVQ